MAQRQPGGRRPTATAAPAADDDPVLLRKLAADAWRRYAEADRRAQQFASRPSERRSRSSTASRVELRVYRATEPPPIRLESDMEEFHKVRRLPPYVFEQVNRLKASARAARRRHHRPRHGQSRPADAEGTSSTSSAKWCATRAPTAIPSSRGIPGLRRAQASYYAPPLRREAQPGHAGRRDARLQGRLRQHGAGDHRAGRRDPVPEPDLSDPRLRLHHVGRRHPLDAGRAGRRLHPGAGARRPPFDPEADGADPQLSVEPDGASRRRSISTRTSSPSPQKHDIIILSDLAYSEIYFDGNPPPSVLQVPGAMDIAVEFTSMSKTFSMPGWRMGFAVGNERLIAALTRVKSYLDYGAFTPIQVAAAAALNGDGADIAEVRDIYHKRRDVMVESFGRAGWTIPAPAASMFAWAPIPEQFRASRLARILQAADREGRRRGGAGRRLRRAWRRLRPHRAGRERAAHPPGGAQHQALPVVGGQAAQQRRAARRAALSRRHVHPTANSRGVAATWLKHCVSELPGLGTVGASVVRVLAEKAAELTRQCGRDDRRDRRFGARPQPRPRRRSRHGRMVRRSGRACAEAPTSMSSSS